MNDIKQKTRCRSRWGCNKSSECFNESRIKIRYG